MSGPFAGMMLADQGAEVIKVVEPIVLRLPSLSDTVPAAVTLPLPSTEIVPPYLVFVTAPSASLAVVINPSAISAVATVASKILFVVILFISGCSGAKTR